MPFSLAPPFFPLPQSHLFIFTSSLIHYQQIGAISKSILELIEQGFYREIDWYMCTLVDLKLRLKQHYFTFCVSHDPIK